MTELSLEAAFAAMFARAAEAMHAVVADEVFPAADANVPVEHGDLKATGKVSGPAIDGETATVAMSWGDPNDKTGIVAIVQHERLDLNHPNGGTAKWAENAQLAAAPDFAARIAAKMGGG